MKVIYTRAVTKDVRKIRDKKLQKAVRKTVENLKKANGIDDVKGVKKMKNYPTAYRIRMGKYRLGFYLEENTIILARFLKRNDIYKVFP